MGKEYKGKKIAWKSILTAVALTSLLSAGGTYAYLTYAEYKDNTMSVGKNEITIEEEFEPPKELTVGENIFKKKVQISNTGTVPCYIRVFAEFSDSDITALSYLSPDGEEYFSAATYYEDGLPDEWTFIPLDDETDGELLGGYYYYTEVVEPGNSTVPLFESVKTEITDASQIKSYDIHVYSESVQTLDKHGEEFTGETPWKEAWEEFLDYR